MSSDCFFPPSGFPSWLLTSLLAVTAVPLGVPVAWGPPLAGHPCQHACVPFNIMAGKGKEKWELMIAKILPEPTYTEKNAQKQPIYDRSQSKITLKGGKIFLVHFHTGSQNTLKLDFYLNCFGGQRHKICLPIISYFSDHMRMWNADSSGCFSLLTSKMSIAPTVM